MTDLKQARNKGKIDEFIEEHEADPEGDIDKLEAVVKRPTKGSGKAVPKASPPAQDDD